MLKCEFSCDDRRLCRCRDVVNSNRMLHLLVLRVSLEPVLYRCLSSDYLVFLQRSLFRLFPGYLKRRRLCDIFVLDCGWNVRPFISASLSGSPGSWLVIFWGHRSPSVQSIGSYLVVCSCILLPPICRVDILCPVQFIGSRYYTDIVEYSVFVGLLVVGNVCLLSY